MILLYRARPIHKLCEFEGKPLPPDYKPDCYQNVDETDYACKEKYRIMVSNIIKRVLFLFLPVNLVWLFLQI